MSCCERFLQKGWCAIEEFLKDKGLLIVNIFANLVCGECLALHLCSKTNFLPRRQFSQEILLLLEDKIKYFYVLSMSFYNANFDLWMSKGAYDVYTLVMNFNGKRLATKTWHCWLDWSYQNYMIGPSSKFDIFVGQLWPKDKNHCLRQEQKV